MRFCPLLLMVAMSSASAQQGASPFEFKKPEPVVAAPAHTASPSDMDLTEKQRATVMEMIASAAETLKVAPEKNVPFEVDGRRYLLLQKGQVYIGANNGTHIIFDELSKDYAYHAVSEINKIIREEEFLRMKEDAASELEQLQQSLMSGVSATPVEHPEPAELSSADLRRQRTEKANAMVSGKPIVKTNPIADKGN